MDLIFKSVAIGATVALLAALVIALAPVLL